MLYTRKYCANKMDYGQKKADVNLNTYVSRIRCCTLIRTLDQSTYLIKLT